MVRDEERLVVALDVDNKERALELVKNLAPYTGMFKVGMELFYAAGPGIISSIKEQGSKVFLDLKLHDIPNTVSRAVKVLFRYGADIINVHAAGGREMMKAAADAAKEEAAAAGVTRPYITAVTVLTSIDREEFNNHLGIPGDIEDRVKHWAKAAQECGLDGVVASAGEAPVIRNECGSDFIIITPGIRPAGSGAGDQKRVLTPSRALEAGATYLVAGRPVINAPDPAAAARELFK